MSEMRLHDPAGNRLYLNAEERAAFLTAARRQPARDRTLCEMLHWTGCRPSELLEIMVVAPECENPSSCSSCHKASLGRRHGCANETKSLTASRPNNTILPPPHLWICENKTL